MAKLNTLKILFVEDLPSDVELEVLELRKEKIVFDYLSVCTRADLEKALIEFNPDLIISDYMMPSFNGLQALKISKEFDPDIPFILCTGSVNEEIAVNCIKAGAEDYVIKEHMTRLPFAVREALEQFEIKKEKKASDLLLKDSEEKLQSVFASAPVGIGLVVNRVIMEVNETLCNIVGYSRKELIGKSSEMLYPNYEIYEHVGKEKYRMIAENGTGSLETLFKCKNGNIINVILSSTPLDKSDYSKGVTFTVLDISDRKRTENELKESHRSLNTLISNLHGIVYRCKNDARWTMEFLSEGSSELTGYSPEELIQNSSVSYNDLIHKDDREYVWTAVQEGLKSQRHFQSTYRIVTKSGEIRWVWEKGEGIFSDEGELEFIEGFITDITDRKNIEESLKGSEEKFRSIAENLSDIIFITDAEGYVKYVSPSCNLFGYSQDEFTGKFFGEFLADGELEKAMTHFRNALNSINISSVVLLVFKRKDGTKFFAELSGSVFKISKNNNGVLGLIRDVSDKVNREEKLRKLSRAVEQNPVSVVITDTDGIIEYVNRKMCEVTGYSESELIGKNPSVLSSQEKSSDDYKILWDTIKAGDDWKGEFHNKKKSGELYWESATISPIKNENGIITHFLGIKEDISLRKLLEEATFESEKRYRELFLNNPVPTYIFDEKTLAFIEVNDATVEYYGYTREEFATMTLKDLRVSEDIPSLINAIGELDNKVFHSVNMRHRKKNGTVIPVEITSHSLKGKNGQRTRLVMAIDISEQVRAAEQMKLAKDKAEASDRLKTMFLNNISHEVRTPLNGILGFAEIINQGDLSEEDRNESLQMLHESSNRLLDTITNYMDISMITSGNLSVSKQEFSPDEMLGNLHEDYKSLSLSKNLELFIDTPYSDNILMIKSDKEILRKIIVHLLSNALKFTESGFIRFGYSIDSGIPEFFVKDSGIGIAKDSLGIIFDRFVKEDLGPYKISEGSGLGLSIVKGMVSLLGGNIRVESEPGKGSSFYFTVPLSSGSPVERTKTFETEPARSFKAKKILVAEDDQTNFFYLNAILTREEGITVLHASNGREAIDLFKLNPDISIILMDVKMPVIDGLEATKQIKLLNKDVPVIAITAYAMSGDEERVLAAGCNAYLSKPISKKNLLDKIAVFAS